MVEQFQKSFKNEGELLNAFYLHEFTNDFHHLNAKM